MMAFPSAANEAAGGHLDTAYLTLSFSAARGAK